MLRYLLTRSLRETAFPQNEHQTTAPAYARRFSARNWIIPSAYAFALLQFAYASSRNSGFGLREASYDTTLSTHVKGGLGRCSTVAMGPPCMHIYPKKNISTPIRSNNYESVGSIRNLLAVVDGFLIHPPFGDSMYTP